MKKLPENTEQWAEEAYIALEVAWKLLKDHYPSLKENEKIELIGYAPELAAMHRNIDDKKEIDEVLKEVCLTLAEDLKLKEEDEPIYYSINFLLSYLESSMLFGFISERQSEQIMDYLCENYDINDKA
jgi:hypothetical protein